MASASHLHGRSTTEMHGHASLIVIIIIKHGDELKPSPSCIQTVTQCRHPNIFSMFKF